MSNLLPQTRKFIHDLSTPVTVAKALAQRCLQEFTEPDTEYNKEKLVERLEKCVNALEKIEKLVIDFKDEFRKVDHS